MEIIFWTLAIVVGSYVIWRQRRMRRNKLIRTHEDSINSYVRAMQAFHSDTITALKGRAEEVAAQTYYMKVPLLVYFIEAVTEALAHYRIPEALHAEMKLRMARIVGLSEPEARGALDAMIVPFRNPLTGENEERGMSAFRAWLEASKGGSGAAAAVANERIGRALQEWQTGAKLERQLAEGLA